MSNTRCSVVRALVAICLVGFVPTFDVFAKDGCLLRKRRCCEKRAFCRPVVVCEPASFCEHILCREPAPCALPVVEASTVFVPSEPPVILESTRTTPDQKVRVEDFPVEERGTAPEDLGEDEIAPRPEPLPPTVGDSSAVQENRPAVFIAFWMSFPDKGDSEIRNWRDSSGQHGAEGRLLWARGTTARIAKTNGFVSTFDLSQLSAEDRNYISSLNSDFAVK